MIPSQRTIYPLVTKHESKSHCGVFLRCNCKKKCICSLQWRGAISYCYLSIFFLQNSTPIFVFSYRILNAFHNLNGPFVRLRPPGAWLIILQERRSFSFALCCENFQLPRGRHLCIYLYVRMHGSTKWSKYEKWQNNNTLLNAKLRFAYRMCPYFDKSPR